MNRDVKSNALTGSHCEIKDRLLQGKMALTHNKIISKNIINSLDRKMVIL